MAGRRMVTKGRPPTRRLRALLGALQPQAPDEHATLQQAGVVQVGPAASEGSLLPYPEHDWTVAPDSAIISDQDATPDQIASWHRNGSAPTALPTHPHPSSLTGVVARWLRYVVIPGFVNAAQLEHWRVSVDGAIERASQFPLATQADNTNDTTVSSVHTHHKPPPTHAHQSTEPGPPVCRTISTRTCSASV